VVKSGDILKVNGEDFDFSQIGEGDTLPASAISSEWFNRGAVDRINGELVLTLTLPNPWNFSPEQAFPVPLVAVLDGPVVFPAPLPEPLIITAPESLNEYRLVPTDNQGNEGCCCPSSSTGCSKS
jgi:hypothetical protein